MLDPTLGLSGSAVHHHRTLIVGNSGSGKSWLASRVATLAACPHIPLDDIYWIDQAALQKRPHAEAKRLLSVRASESTWVIEGVFSWLIAEALARASTLIWLDLPWDECRAGLLKRGPLPGQSQAEFDDLLVWAAAYWDRRSSSSHAGHQALYERFASAKLAFRSRREVDEFARAVHA